MSQRRPAPRAAAAVRLSLGAFNALSDLDSDSAAEGPSSFPPAASSWVQAPAVRIAAADRAPPVSASAVTAVAAGDLDDSAGFESVAKRSRKTAAAKPPTPAGAGVGLAASGSSASSSGSSAPPLSGRLRGRFLRPTGNGHGAICESSTGIEIPFHEDALKGPGRVSLRSLRPNAALSFDFHPARGKYAMDVRLDAQ